MDFVLALLVLAAALAVLAYPLYRSRSPAPPATVSTLDDLLAQRDEVYATLRDIELDKQLGKLDDADYAALHEKYVTRAAEILQELDTLRGEGGGAQASAEIEKQVAALRKGASVAASSNGKRASASECPNCGRPYNAGDKFCARCGRALS